jgi:DNA-binding NarL/FixJ family response regulator
MSRPVTVLIADDHPPTRAGVRAALENKSFHVCAEVGAATAAIEAAVREQPDICLLDIHMPGNGIAAAAAIAEAAPETTIVMLTVSHDEGDLLDSLRAGASGYLLKDTDPARLAPALSGVLAGEAALPRTLVARLITEFRAREHRRRLPLLKERGVELTPREWDVLEFLRRGLTTAEVAAELSITPVTVRTHVATVLKKLRVSDRQAALRLFDGM